MARQVLLPRELESRWDNLTGLVQEVDGILLYRSQIDYCLLETLFVTGVGTEGHVQALPERIEIANEFFQRNPDYRFVKFHTHSKGTINKFGQYYANHFSQGDIDGIKNQLKEDRDFIALLITPETKLLSGIDNPQLVIVSNFSGYAQRSHTISDAIKLIARNKGYDISRLSATRRNS